MNYRSQEALPNRRHDEVVITQVMKQFDRHSHLRLQRIWCEIDDGRLILRGQVPSFYLKQLAQEAVQNVAGIGQIVNEVEVVW